MIEEILGEVIRLKKELNSQYEDIYKSEGDLQFAFRGETKNYENTKLMPSIFRNLNSIEKELHIYELMSDYELVSKNDSTIEKLINAQHYLQTSRMLDITFNVLVALYFACEDYKDDLSSDAVLYIFAFPKKYSPHSNFIEKFYSDMLKRDHIPYHKNFKVLSHTYSNERIKAQDGGFIFFTGFNFSPISECYYKSITIKKSDKSIIINELSTYFNMSKATIYPEKSNIAELAKDIFNTNRYVENSVCLKDELENYFERIYFELKSFKKSGKGDLKRILRKEKNDLIIYIDKYIEQVNSSSNDINKKKEIIENIKVRFKVLEINLEE